MARRNRVEPNIGLSRALETVRYMGQRKRDRESHDGLCVRDANPPASGHCGCLCSHCWRWSDGRRKRGLCICFDCPCGGATWYPRSIINR